MSPHDESPIALSLARLEVRLENIAEDTGEIKTQVQKTNGRVTALEGWRSKMTGALAALAVLGPIISGVVTALIVTQLT
jgi:hypothetical protein